MTGEHRRRRLTRLLAGVGVAWGTALLAVPDGVTDALCPELPRDRRWVVRVLGARMVVEHATLLVAPVRPVPPIAAAVESLHAVSMLTLLGRPRYRRAALVSGGIAAVSAVALATVPGSPR
ncbi:hypothetical protein ACI79D_15130 [Geodermatophilus sp. SYSU D00708]